MSKLPIRSSPPSNAELRALGKAIGRTVETSSEYYSSYIHIFPTSEEQVPAEIILMIPKDSGLDATMRIAAAAALMDMVHVPGLKKAKRKPRKTTILDLDDDGNISDGLASETQQAASDNLRKARR